MDIDPLRRATGMGAEEFAALHWGREPLLRRRAELPGDGFAHLLDLDAVDELVSRRGLRTPFFRMAKEGQVLPASRVTRGGGAGAEIADQAADDKVLAEFAAGATLVLQGLHRTWPPVAAFTSGLVAQLGHPAQVNAYVTPAQSTGFSPHYDVHDVFVLQFAGRKRWRIHEPVLEAPLRDQPWDARREAVAARAEEPPLIDTVLEPGDALYLPRGYLHAATALGGISGHLTIGVQPVTRTILVEPLMAAASNDLELRRSLPAARDLGDPEVLEEELKATREALHAAVERLQAADLAAVVRRHLADRTRPEPLSPLAQVAAAEALDPTGVVRLRPGLRCEVEHGSDRVTLRALGRSLRLPPSVGPAVREIVDGAPVRVTGLGGLDDADALTLVRRLLREGIVVPVGPT